MRSFKLHLATAALAACAFAAVALPSSASARAISCKTTVYHPSDNSWTCASGPAGWYRACDYAVDGHRVRGHIDVAGSATDDRYTAWAPSQGCTEWAGVTYGGIYILRIQTCTEHEGCSAWKKVS